MKWSEEMVYKMGHRPCDIYSKCPICEECYARMLKNQKFPKPTPATREDYERFGLRVPKNFREETKKSG